MDQKIWSACHSWCWLSMVARLPGMRAEWVDVLETQPNRKQSGESCKNGLINKTYIICNYYDCFELEITWPWVLIDWLINQFIYPSCSYSWITRAPATILLIFISTKTVHPFSPGNCFNTAIYSRARAKRISLVGFRGNGYYVWKKTVISEILH